MKTVVIMVKAPVAVDGWLTGSNQSPTIPAQQNSDLNWLRRANSERFSPSAITLYVSKWKITAQDAS